MITHNELVKLFDEEFLLLFLLLQAIWLPKIPLSLLLQLIYNNGIPTRNTFVPIKIPGFRAFNTRDIKLIELGLTKGVKVNVFDYPTVV